MLKRYVVPSLVVGLLLGGQARLGATEDVAAGEAPFSPELRLTAETAYAAAETALLPILEPSVAIGQTEDRTASMGFKAGMGFSASPTTFLMTYQLDFFIVNPIAIGPLFQFGISDDDFFFAPTLNLQAMFDLPGEGFEGLKPTLQFGLGLVYLDREYGGGRDDDDVDFLVNFGFGLEYFFNEYVAIGTNFLFNFVPGEVLDDNFFFGWQVITFRFQF